MYHMNNDVTSESDVKPCIKIDKTLVVYMHVFSILMLRSEGHYISYIAKSCALHTKFRPKKTI